MADLENTVENEIEELKRKLPSYFRAFEPIADIVAAQRHLESRTLKLDRKTRSGKLAQEWGVVALTIPTYIVAHELCHAAGYLVTGTPLKDISIDVGFVGGSIVAPSSDVGHLIAIMAPYAMLTPTGILFMEEGLKQKRMSYVGVGSTICFCHMFSFLGDFRVMGTMITTRTYEAVSGNTVGFEVNKPSPQGATAQGCALAGALLGVYIMDHSYRLLKKAAHAVRDFFKPSTP